MKKLMVHPQKCTGCRSCMLICSFMHADACDYEDSRIKVASEESRGRHTPNVCRFCEDPLCVAACPVDALSKKSETNAIRVDTALCNGCQSCVSACPYEAMFFDPRTDRAFTCDLCGGDPECVKVCQLPEALVWS